MVGIPGSPNAASPSRLSLIQIDVMIYLDVSEGRK